MMKTSFILFLLTLSQLSFSMQYQGPRETSIINDWVQLGENGNLCREGFNGWYLEELVVNEQTFIFEETLYQDPQCEQAVTKSILTFSYDFPKSTQAKAVDLAVETYELMPLSKSAVDQYNRVMNFGYADWKINEKTDVTGLAPQPYKKVLYAKGDLFKSLYHKGQTYLKLRMGFKNGERPQDFDIFKRYHATSPL